MKKEYISDAGIKIEMIIDLIKAFRKPGSPYSKILSMEQHAFLEGVIKNQDLGGWLKDSIWSKFKLAGAIKLARVAGVLP